MNILKYLIAETINDKDTEDFIEVGQTQEVNHDSIADSVFQAFIALSQGNAEVGSREQVNARSVLTDSDIILNEGIFSFGGFTAHLDSVH